MPNYVRVIRRGSINVRVLLENGETQLVRISDLPNWTRVGGGVDTITETPRQPRTPRTGFVNPENQSDRIFERIFRRGSRNTSVLLQDGTRLSIPNEYISTWVRRGSRAYYDLDEEINYPNGRAITHLTFGVELEFVANPDKYNDFCRAMIDALGPERFYASGCYGRSSTNRWVLGTDSSVHSTSSRNNKRGYELTSPILKFDEASKEELTKVLNIISTVFDGSVNRTCGTHIHVGNFACMNNSTDFVNKAKRFQRNYGYFEARVFDRLVSPSRKGNNNHYCKSCNIDYITDRYHKINIQKLLRIGTIENRQHQGTLELKKIWSWMELNGRYITQYYKDPSLFDDTSKDLESFMETIGLSNEAQEFFLAREAELNV